MLGVEIEIGPVIAYPLTGKMGLGVVQEIDETTKQILVSGGRGQYSYGGRAEPVKDRWIFAHSRVVVAKSFIPPAV